jgi:hypothetical protein
MNENNAEKKIMNDIFVLTTMIQKEFPELYKSLWEVPFFLSDSEKKIKYIDFEQYLESLRMKFMAFQKRASEQKKAEDTLHFQEEQCLN